jgi:hypothetical protein
MRRHRNDTDRLAAVDSRHYFEQSDRYPLYFSNPGQSPHLEVPVEIGSAASDRYYAPAQKFSDQLGESVCVVCGLCQEADRRSVVLFPLPDSAPGELISRLGQSTNGVTTWVARISGFACNGDPASRERVRAAYEIVVARSASDRSML